MPTVISPLYYFAPIHVYACYVQCDKIIIEGQENYQKGSFRNKCKIGTAQGNLLLSIPLRRGKHQQQRIRDSQISFSENWNLNHLRSIKTAYGKAPYFEHYIDILSDVIMTTQATLWEFNWSAFQVINSLISLDTPISVTSTFQKDIDADLDLRFFKAPVFAFPAYPQVHEMEQGFQPGLSILDLLFHLGPESKHYLKNCAIKSLQI